uniref:RING-type domain-containing protein n=1 Tax=Cyclopterus lumpus TaxID=8103 RepID=A0A8C2WJG7_CYCLU
MFAEQTHRTGAAVHLDKDSGGEVLDLSCSICQDVFKDPVVLSCSHSFCKDCLKKMVERETNSGVLVIKNLCESFLLQRDQRAPETLCSLGSQRGAPEIPEALKGETEAV